MRPLAISLLLVASLATCGFSRAFATPSGPARPGAPAVSLERGPGGAIRRLAFGDSPPLAGWESNHAAAISDLLHAAADVLGARTGVDGLTFVSETREPGSVGMVHVRLQQTYRNLPVLGHDLNLALRSDGRPVVALGRFAPGIAIDVTPRISASEAIRRASTRLPEARFTGEARLGVEDWDAPRLVYELRGTDHAVPTRFILDANDGALVSEVPLRAYDVGCDPSRVGIGRVYPSDGRDSSAWVERPLENLRIEDQLAGCRVYACEWPHVLEGCNPVQGVNLDFRFPPSDSRFVAVNAYWHAEHFVEALTTLGVDPASYTPVTVSVNELIGDGGCGACSEPGSVKLSQQYATGGNVNFRNFGLAADVIDHEMQHLVTASHGIDFPDPAATQRWRREHAALVEAISDYVAAAVTGDPHINEWVVARCDGNAHGGAGRWLDSDASLVRYENFDHVSGCDSGVGNYHANGMIVSGALWDLRAVVGGLADRMVLETLGYLPSVPDFQCFADALWQTTIDHHTPGDAMAVLRAFQGRGIWHAQRFLIDGPPSIAAGAVATYQVVPASGTAGAVRVHWKSRVVCGVGCLEWTDLGESPSITVTGTRDFELAADLIDAWSRPATAATTIAVTPVVAIVGPGSVAAGASATWCAAVQGGAPPLRFQWTRRDGSTTSVGTDSCVTVASCTPYTLRLSVFDASLHGGFDSRAVAITGSCTGTSLLVEARRAHGSAALVRLEAPLAESRLRVIDVGGRTVAGPGLGTVATDGTLRWDASDLAPGVYFYVLSGAVTRATRKFVICE